MHDQDSASAENSKDDEGSPGDAVDSYGGNLNLPPVRIAFLWMGCFKPHQRTTVNTHTHPIHKSTQDLVLGTYPRRRDFARTKPRERQLANPQEDLKDEHKRRYRIRRVARRNRKHNRRH